MSSSLTHKSTEMRHFNGIFVYFLMYIGHELQGLSNPKETYIFLCKAEEYFVLFMAP